jgi:hypothetical protein
MRACMRKCQVNSDKREARFSVELAYPLETAPGTASSPETGQEQRRRQAHRAGDSRRHGSPGSHGVIRAAAPALAHTRLTPRPLQAVIENANCYASMPHPPCRLRAPWVSRRSAAARAQIIQYFRLSPAGLQGFLARSRGSGRSAGCRNRRASRPPTAGSSPGPGPPAPPA